MDLFKNQAGLSLLLSTSFLLTVDIILSFIFVMKMKMEGVSSVNAVQQSKLNFTSNSSNCTVTINYVCKSFL